MNKLQVRNERIINAPASIIGAVITDINLLHKVNPGVVTASGRMDRQGESRTSQGHVLTSIKLITEIK